jgi:hypothetical protein
MKVESQNSMMDGQKLKWIYVLRSKPDEARLMTSVYDRDDDRDHHHAVYSHSYCCFLQSLDRHQNAVDNRCRNA